MTLKKIFQHKQSLFQKIFSGVGFGIGLFLVLMSVHIHIQIQEALQQKNNASEFITIGKQVSMGNTIFLQKNDFQPKEITELQNQPFIEKIGFFMPNQYSVVAFAKQVGFVSELFFESIEDEFLDELPRNFKWQPDDETIPIILARGMLDLYNFGYALGKNMPQISENTAKLVSVNIQIAGKNGKKQFKGRVVGFSQRYSTILVPNSFMQWANKNIGGTTESLNPSRLVVKVKNPADTRISNYFAQKSYVANEQNMRIAQTGGIVQIIMAVLGVVGFVFMLLAFVVMVLQFNVVLAEAKPEIILLLQIGYLPNQILRFLGQQIAVFLGVVFVCVAIMVYSVGEYANGILQTRGLGLQNGVSIWIFGLEFLLILILFLLQMWQTKRIMDYKFVSV